MDRAAFLARLRGAAVKLTPYTIPGWDEPVYLRPMSMADVKEQLARGDTPDSMADRLKADPFVLERRLARVLLNEKGERIFDPADDEQMTELRAVLDGSTPDIVRQIHDAHDALQEPSPKDGVDAKGN